MQNPRGSNDRMNENSADRQNAQRLFNSQNNARGGYCWGPPLNYYAGSHLSIEWTAQHGCGFGNLKCNYILQYMCGYTDGPEEIRIRDGTTTGTIPDDANAFNTKDDTTGLFTFGMHESYDYYQSCKARSRNQGLFTSDQNVGQNTNAVRTRQNAGGTRHGFECPEERDYYPYWAPSPWKDIAILTDNPKKMCPYYEKESQNVASKSYCEGQPAITQQECESTGGSWQTAAAWGIEKPDCDEAPFSRDNHLGNGLTGGHTNSYNWTLPTEKTEKCIVGDKCACVLRLRYNITTAEIDGYGDADGSFDDSRLNKDPPITQDPDVWVFGKNLSLAVNTNQFGRTFQDRSHIFGIKSRPKDVSNDADIWNLNVRGKRGNIVQTFPATEYDFVPQTLNVKVGDYVHFQWTGCDTNPDNEGEGRDRTDRSNIVQTEYAALSQPISDDRWAALKGKLTPMFPDRATQYLMAHIGQPEDQCHTYDQLMEENNNNEDAVEQSLNNCMKLNAAPTPYFDGGLVQMKTEGTFYYMSTRNNNFSNRTQKGVLVVGPLLEPWAVALVVIGGVIAVSGATLGGLVLYARKYPHSAVASKLDTVWAKVKNFKIRG